MIDRYCTEANCQGGENCLQGKAGNCVYEYVASKDKPHYNWLGDGPPPRRWVAADGTHVYRSFADYCDD